jgi:UDP-N-acetylenolpyruvoylglucosamine reductase
MMDRQEAIRDMMQSMAQGRASEVQDKFNNIMQARAGDALNDYKQELARSVFKNPELEAMGLADGEDHILEVDPAAEPETVETGDDNEDV